MNKLVIAFVLLFSHLSFAGSYVDYYKNCVLNKKGHYPYRFSHVDSLDADLYTPSGSFDTVTHHAISGIVRSSTRVFDEARNAVSLISNNGFIEGKKIRLWTISSIKEQIRKYHLNKFEKAALVNCAVYSLIDYTENMSTKFGSVLEIYEVGEGICTEMTSIALDLASAVGFKTRNLVSRQHNWPEYYIDGTWYILDPTAPSSIFMESLKQ